MPMNQVEPGDYVKDPMDGQLRCVSRVSGEEVFMTDGGVMGLDECSEVLLPSEVESVVE
jgi:hypothetical protein